MEGIRLKKENFQWKQGNTSQKPNRKSPVGFYLNAQQKRATVLSPFRKSFQICFFHQKSLAVEKKLFHSCAYKMIL